MGEITGKVKISQQNIKNISDLRNKIESVSSKKATDLLEVILNGAVELEASDIHIEPQEQKARIRVRIDGILQDAALIDKEPHAALLSRIKLLARIKLNVESRPQNGRFSLISSSSIEIRASTLPTEKGESIVLRILNPKSLVEIEALGLRKNLLELFRKEIERPNGMIIVTGPTGSGKTTALYSFLKRIQKPEIKIITIEDPVEYRLKGVSQTQIQKKKGYDFASGLKSIMRQDPDVILVGEIRDPETVKTALQAALTGHLVLTTLHTNDAAGTISRMISLGAKPSNIGPAINLAVAQRLVRKICKKCGKLKKPSAQELQKIKFALKKVPKNIRILSARGCKYCNSTGYRGRIGIFEAFVIDDEMEKFILTSPSIAALRKMAIKRGMTTIRHDGFIKVLDGITTIDEVERVVGKKIAPELGGIL